LQLFHLGTSQKFLDENGKPNDFIVHK